MRQWTTLEGWRGMLSRVQRPELEQAVLRVVLVGLVYAYVVWTVHRDGVFDGTDFEFVSVGAGFVSSLARPGGNITGLSLQTTDLAAKRLELLREVVPGIRRLGVLTRREDCPYTPPLRRLRQLQMCSRHACDCKQLAAPP